MSARLWILPVVLALIYLAGAAAPHAWADEGEGDSPQDVPQDPEAAGRPPATIQQLEKALDRLARRIDELLEMAARDPRHRRLDTYEGYSRADFANSRRPVKAKDLLDIIADGDAPDDLRLRAAKLLASKDAQSRDPELVAKKGNEEPRKRFGKLKLAKLLTKSDEYTRKLAHGLLVAFFPDHRNDPLVVTYDPVNGTTSEWRKTANYWKKVLGR